MALDNKKCGDQILPHRDVSCGYPTPTGYLEGVFLPCFAADLLLHSVEGQVQEPLLHTADTECLTICDRYGDLQRHRVAQEAQDRPSLCCGSVAYARGRLAAGRSSLGMDMHAEDVWQTERCDQGSNFCVGGICRGI